jgi:hypothetical protein
VHRSFTGAGLASAVVLALVLGGASLVPAAPAPADSAAVKEDEDKVPVRFTAGGELTPEEEKEVRATLLAYLGDIQKRNWRGAAQHVERASFLEGIPAMIASIAPDPAKRAEATGMLFGVTTMDSVRAKPTGDLFHAVMTYATTADPASVEMMGKAKFALLGARRIKDRVHIAYQLTVPAASDTLQPYTQVTAERLRRVGKEWKIVFQHDR